MDQRYWVTMMEIGLFLAMAGAGLYAYFSDTETSIGNVFIAEMLVEFERHALLFEVEDMTPEDSETGWDINSSQKV